MIPLDLVFFAAIVMSVGVLFMDLVPLQETMICNDYNNDTVCPEKFFSQSYFDARSKFIAAAKNVSAVLDSHVVLNDQGADLTIDTAFVQGKSKDQLLIHISGTHGVEGFAGSAIQTKLMRSWNESRKNGPSVLFIHGLNPYGTLHNRRFNEENVDLNRNMLTPEQWKEVVKRDPNYGGYETFRHFLVPSDPPRLVDRYVMLFRAVVAVAQHGYGALKRAFVTGQYHHKEGLYFGGFEEQRSITILRKILKPYEHSADVILLDVHTGLGKNGVDTLMVGTEEEERITKQIFSANVQNDHTSASGPSSGYNLAIGFVRTQGLFHKNALSITEEFGTVTPVFVARAVVLENAAYHHARGTYVHRIMGDWMRDAFYPQAMAFKQRVLKNGVATFDCAWKYLASKQK